MKWEDCPWLYVLNVFDGITDKFLCDISGHSECLKDTCPIVKQGKEIEELKKDYHSQFQYDTELKIQIQELREITKKQEKKIEILGKEKDELFGITTSQEDDISELGKRIEALGGKED